MTQGELFTIKRKSFEEYDRENPQIWGEFERRALALLDVGAKRVSAKMLFEVIRYFTHLRAKDGDFKLNNTFTPFYARKFVERHPEHADAFETRRAKADMEI